MLNARGIKAQNWHKVCLVCGKDFTYADGFECMSQPGRHVIDSKMYYHLGAGHIQSHRDRQMFAPLLNLIADMEVRDKVTGRITSMEGLRVHFHERGLYETTDPLEQYHLDMHPGLMTGPEGKEAWDRMYLTRDQQLAKAQAQLADVHKQIRESNALLEAVKAEKGNKKDGVALR
jgi:hypothetical protein